jgi:hypothetical protein
MDNFKQTFNLFPRDDSTESSCPSGFRFADRRSVRRVA